MVSNLVVRNKRTGYVSFVAKARVDGESRTVEYICGLGNMDQGEFKHFQKWAHSIKDQRMRRDRVLACPMVVEEKEKVEGKVATEAQKKTTVKRAPKKMVVDKKKQIKTRVEKEKAWYKALSKEEQQRYTEKQTARVLTQTKELKTRFKVFGKTKDEKRVVTYKINDLTRAQELEAEIKTLKGDKADKKLIQEREKKIKNILGKKYKSCREVATAANKGDVFVDAS